MSSAHDLHAEFDKNRFVHHVPQAFAKAGMECRAGIIPLQLNRDIGGPIGRTVTDVAKLFTALTDFSMFPEGYDPRDPVTAFRLNYTLPSNYTQFLNASGLQVCVIYACITHKGDGCATSS